MIINGNTGGRRRRSQPARRMTFSVVGAGGVLGHYGLSAEVQAMVSEDGLAGATIAASILEALRRFPHDEQPALFEQYRCGALSGRRLKRYVDNTLFPPSQSAIVGSIKSFLSRDFPAVSAARLREALLVAATALPDDLPPAQASYANPESGGSLGE